nr:esterase B1-like [Leptinotarsa decemlineata]
MSDDIVVTVEEGKVRGKIQEDYHGGKFYSFSGIPYGKAPIGDLRFKAPVPAEPWEGVKDGTKEGYECPSKDMYLGYYIGNEDNCLNLNVYTKELPSRNNVKKPVMVFIHGGGFMYGCNKSAYFGPHYLMSEDIVLVAINYRLGVFGFLSLEDQSLGVPGNAGLKDQTLALKWVQKNINNFGGDPQNVTIFGESAGSASVHYLTLSPLTKGLFHKAIMQSGSALNPWARGRRNFADIAKAIGYKDADEKTVFQKLCRASARSLVSAQFKIEDSFFASLVRPLGPVIEYPHEGAFLTEDPEEIIKSGKNHQIPMIIGYNSLEGLFYEIMRKTRNDANLPKNLERDIPYDLNILKNQNQVQEVAQKMKEFYYKSADLSESNIHCRYMLVSDVHFVYGIQKSATLLKRHGTAPVYVYRMSLNSSLNYFKKFCEVKYFKTMILVTLMTKLAGSSSLKGVFQSLYEKLPANKVDGVSHADDLFYLFTTFFSPTIVRGSEEDISIQKFVKPWTNFAKYGNPTPEKDETLNGVIWKPIESEEVDNIFDINKEVTITKNLECDRVSFWEKMYQQYAERV